MIDTTLCTPVPATTRRREGERGESSKGRSWGVGGGEGPSPSEPPTPAHVTCFCDLWGTQSHLAAVAALCLGISIASYYYSSRAWARAAAATAAAHNMVPQQPPSGPQGLLRLVVLVVVAGGRQLGLQGSHQVAHHLLIHLRVQENLIQQIRARRHLFFGGFL